MGDHPACHVYQILHHAAQPAAEYVLAQRRSFFFSNPFLPQRLLATQPETIIRGHPKQQHDRIRRKLPGWQPLQVHIAFDLRVKLLARSMSVIQVDNRFRLLLQGGFIGLDFHFRKQKILALAIDGPYRHFEHLAERFLDSFARDVDISSIHHFP